MATVPFPSPFSSLERLEIPTGWVLAASAAFILAGAVVIGAPDRAGAIVGGLSGWALWFAGVSILAAWFILMLAGRPLLALLTAGVVAAASGAFLFYNPRAGAVAITILAASALVMDGGLQTAIALRLRPVGMWRWLFASALASLCAAAVTAHDALTDADTNLAVPIGVALLTSGAALAFLGWDLRHAVKGRV